MHLMIVLIKDSNINSREEIMNVKELINKLQQLDPDLIVKFDTAEHGPEEFNKVKYTEFNHGPQTDKEKFMEEHRQASTKYDWKLEDEDIEKLWILDQKMPVLHDEYVLLGWDK